MSPVLLLCTVLLSSSIDHIVSAQNVSPTRRNNESSEFASGEIIWQDEFDYFDKGKWNNEINLSGGGNNEFQIYDDYGENAYVRNGILYIRPTLSLNTVFGGNYEKLYNGYLNLEGCTDETGCSRQAQYPHINPPVVSQRLRTKGVFSFRYGRVEVRARLPSGDWTWPAIWMLPEDKKYGGWPASGEIDILESRGNRKLFNSNGINIGSEQMGSTLHFGPRWPYNGYKVAHGTKHTPTDQGYDRDFHVYEFFWNTEMIQFKVDGVIIKSVQPPQGGFFELGNFPGDIANPWVNGSNPRMSPFDENRFLDFFNNRTSWFPTWDGENAAMAVDYIRVYAA